MGTMRLTVNIGIGLLILFGACGFVYAEPDEDQEETLSEGRQFAKDLLLQSGRPSQIQEPDMTRDEVPKEGMYEGDQTIYMQHLIPGYNQNRNWEMNEALQAVAGNAHEECGHLNGDAYAECVSEHEATPANLPEMSEDYAEQMGSGVTPEAKAWQATRQANQQERYQFYTPDEGVHDPIFNQMETALDPDSPMYQSLIGDCETVTHSTVEVNPVKFEDIKTCNQVYAPAPDAFECQAQRNWSAQVAENDRLIAVITPLVSEAQCIEEAGVAIAACELSQCAEVGVIEQQTCEIAQCTGLEGEDLVSCQATCAQQGQSAEQACETRDSGCEVLGEATSQLCVAEQQCGADAACIVQCIAEGDQVAMMCGEDCADAGEAAFLSCMENEGEGGIFNGTQLFDLWTFGPSASFVTPDGLFQIQSQPFSQGVTPSDPEFFAAGHRVEVDGGFGELLSNGSLANKFRGEVLVTGQQISEIRFYASLFSVQQNSIDGCGPFMDTLADGFCAGEMTCTNDPGNCVQLAPGVTTCEGGPSAGLISVLRPWHSQAVPWGATPELAPRRCMSAQAENVECEQFITGTSDEFCYLDIHGVERCIVGEGYSSGDLAMRLGPEPYLDNCGALIDRPECELESKDTCAEDGEGVVSGRCYVPDVLFDCGETHWVESEVGTQTEVSCEGELMCMGNECATVEDEKSNSDKAVKGTALVQQLGMDTTCFESDEDTPNIEVGEDCTPVFFRGEAMECKIPIGADQEATPDCCDEGREVASDESYIEYMQVTSGIYAAATAPGEAKEQSNTQTRDGDQGSHISTPDWLEVADGTYYVPPDEGTGRGDLFLTPERDTEGNSTARSWFLDPEELAPASEAEGNYVGRPMASAFEASAARFGYVPTDEETLQDAKTAAQSQGDGSMQAAIGNTVSAGLPTAWSVELFHADGTPKYQISRNEISQSITARSTPRRTGDSESPSQSRSGGSYNDGISVTEAAKMSSGNFFLQQVAQEQFQCTEEEAELGLAREQRRCSYVGKYCKQSVGFGPFKTCIESREVHCCFNSAFAREFMEEYNDQHGLDFGTAKQPICEGLAISELSNLNMNGVDLTEWTTMMTMSKQIPGQGISSESEPSAWSRASRVIATTSESERPGWIPDGQYIRTVDEQHFSEERLTPRRVIPGSDINVAGPDGIQSATDRIASRVAQNALAMHATKEALRQRDTGQHDVELMRWYSETTHNSNPPYNPDLGIPPDMGQTPDECLGFDPPADHERVVADSNGTSLESWLPPAVGTSEKKWLFIDEGQYAAIGIDDPQVGDWFFTHPAVAGVDPVSRTYEMNIHRCPGYFGSDIASTCTGASSGTFLTSSLVLGFGFLSWTCTTGLDGDRVYLNIRSRTEGECVHAGYDPLLCAQEVTYGSQ